MTPTLHWEPDSLGALHGALPSAVAFLLLQGVPCVQAVGEGEAMCAALNLCGWCHACHTLDVDVLLFGALTVFKQMHLQVMLELGGRLQHRHNTHDQPISTASAHHSSPASLLCCLSLQADVVGSMSSMLAEQPAADCCSGFQMHAVPCCAVLWWFADG